MDMRALLFEPVRFGEITLRNRIVMAPMTRSRADARGVPTAIMVEYYAQRAEAGLIIAEGTAPCADGLGYCRTPGIYNDEQIHAWRKVTQSVHAHGGQIVLQLMHCGRIGSRHTKPPGTRILAPSAIAADVQIFSDAMGLVNADCPEALSVDGIAAVIADYRQATCNAIEAGFDGVELHASSGYLPMQFMAENANRRKDAYGGSVHNRIRFTLEVLTAMCEAIGPGRIGLRLCPGNPYNDILDSNPAATLSALLAGIAEMNLAWLHLMRTPVKGLDAFAIARAQFCGALIVNDGFDADSAAAMLSTQGTDAVSFARHFIANPDLVERWRTQQPLAQFDRKQLYTPGASGYSDYPAAVGAFIQESA